MAAKCYLNGAHADALGAVGWRFVTGVEPNVQAFEMEAKEAAKLLDSGGEVTLVIQDQATERIEKLFVIGEGPSSAPYSRTVLVADLRWKWSRAHVYGRYNIRRRTGTKTLLNEGLVELAQTADDFQFHPASIKGGLTKFTPVEVVSDVLNQLCAPGKFEYTVETNTDKLEVNDLEIDDPGPDGMAIALRHLPGSSLWVDKTGRVIIQNAVALRESGVLASTGDEVMGGGHVSKVSYKYTRPSQINIYFTREQEIRVDSTSGGATHASENRLMVNVVMITDPEVTVGGLRMANGSWCPFDSIFSYWNSTREFGTALTWSHGVIQAAFFEGKLYSVFLPGFGNDNPQPLAAGRIAATQHHYRTTFQINRRLRDRLWTIMPTRAAILDVTTGKRGRAQAFTDYCVRPSARHIDPDPAKQQFFKNVRGYAAAIADATVSPAVVDVLDDEAGIIHLDYTVDRYGAVWQIYPSLLVNVPTANMGDNKPRGLNVKSALGEVPALADEHNVSVILTGVPAYPNSLGQFYKIEVKPGDVLDKVPGLVIDPSNGPIWDIHIGGGKVTARMAWMDQYSGTIERSIGIGLPDPASLNTPEARAAADEQAKNDAANLELLLVNKDDLTSVAHAVAATIWSKLSDRWIGCKTVRMDPNVSIKGAVDSYEHVLDTDGTVLTRILLPEFLKDRDPMSLLSESARRMIFREVVPK